MINSGDTGFIIICAALVLLMTPGLAFFYGGMVRRKNVDINFCNRDSYSYVGVIWIFFSFW